MGRNPANFAARQREAARKRKRQEKAARKVARQRDKSRDDDDDIATPEELAALGLAVPGAEGDADDDGEEE